MDSRLTQLLTNATTPAAGAAVGFQNSVPNRVFQASVAGTGVLAASVKIEVSADPINLGWITLGTIDLAGTTTATDGFAIDAAWPYTRASLVSVSGTNAVVNCAMGI